MSRAALICDKALWAGGHPPGHPLRPERLRDTWEMLQAYHAFDPPNATVVPPRSPTDKELATFHSREYIDMVRRLSREKRGSTRPVSTLDRATIPYSKVCSILKASKWGLP